MMDDENGGFSLVDNIDIADIIRVSFAENTQTLFVLWNCSVEDKLHNLISFCLLFSGTAAKEMIWIIWFQTFFVLWDCSSTGDNLDNLVSNNCCSLVPDIS